MGSEVLARKWRPKTFADLVGQEHITRTLVNGLNAGRLHHAYLFAGTRGVGKTTLARILAKSFSCEERKTAEPCNSCPVCSAIDCGNYQDLIEVDAASRTGVEDTRELLSDTQFAPSKGKYKIYLIDEVHMLSNHSFNALLKTLEEPPPHILFLFATTDLQKLPGTVLSRCLKFHLKPLRREDIATHLKKILQEEGIEYDEEALKHLAYQADGSMRDALSLTDQAISYCREKLNAKEVAEMLGIAGIPPAEDVLFYLAKDDPKALLDTTRRIENSGGNFADLADRLLETIQSIAVLQTKAVKPTNDEKRLVELAGLFSAEELQIYYQTIILTKKEFPWTPSVRRAFEMGLLRMLSLQPMLNAKSKVLPKEAPPSASENMRSSSSGKRGIDDKAQLLIGDGEPQQTGRSVHTHNSSQITKGEEGAAGEESAAKKEGEAKEEGEEKPQSAGQQDQEGLFMQEERNANADGQQKTEPKEEKEEKKGATEDAYAWTSPRGWARFVRSLDAELIKGRLDASLEHTRLLSAEQGLWIIGCAAAYQEPLVSAKERLEEAITRQIKQKIMLEIQIAAVEHTPFMLTEERQKQLIRNTKEDPLVKTLEKEFGGELDESSIQNSGVSINE